MHTPNHSRLLTILLLSLVALGLSGCVRARVGFDLRPDGSGTVTAAYGVTQQAKAMIASQGGTSDPSKGFFKSDGGDTSVRVRQWDDGDYEWTEGTRAFVNVDELNTLMKNGNMFEQFSLDHQHGLLKDRFVLDARTKPMDDNARTGQAAGLNIDPEQFIRLQIGARLPGNIVETNGTRDAKDPSSLLWQIRLRESTTLRAVSETWNWMTIGIAGAGTITLVIVGLGGYWSMRKPKVTTALSPTLQSGVTDSSR